MRIWLALLVAPSIALACQSIMFALVTPACSVQTRIAIHAVAAVSLLLCVAFTLMARGASLPMAASPDEDTPAPAATRHFLAVCASAVGTISALVVIGMWIGAWVLSPCYS